MRLMGFLLGLLLAISGCFLAPSHRHDHLPKMLDLNGHEQSLAPHLGGHTLLFLGASWCPECVLELQCLNSLSEKLVGKNVHIVMVAIDDSIEAMKSLPPTNKARFPILIDSQDQIKEQYPVSGLPTVYLLDAQGETLPLIDPEDGETKEVVVGFREWQSAAGIQAILRSLPNVTEERLPPGQ